MDPQSDEPQVQRVEKIIMRKGKLVKVIEYIHPGISSVEISSLDLEEGFSNDSFNVRE